MAIEIDYKLLGQVNINRAYIKLIRIDSRRSCNGWQGSGCFGVFVDRDAAQKPVADEKAGLPMFIQSQFSQQPVAEINIFAEWGIDDNAAKAFYAALKLGEQFKDGKDV